MSDLNKYNNRTRRDPDRRARFDVDPQSVGELKRPVRKKKPRFRLWIPLAIAGAAIGLFLLTSMINSGYVLRTNSYDVTYNGKPKASSVASGTQASSENISSSVPNAVSGNKADEATLSLTKKTLTEILGDGKVVDDQRLISAKSLLPDDYRPDLVDYIDNFRINPRVKQGYEDMIRDNNKETGEFAYIFSAFRSKSQQADLNLQDSKFTQVPGGSEHESGLALDIMVDTISDERFADTPSGKFTNSNCWKYGFIVRYQKGKENITGIPFEPWHFRYVGIPHAQIMEENNWAMEEYLDYLKSAKYMEFGDYVISMQAKTQDNNYYVPDGYNTVSVSESLKGYYVLTFIKKSAAQ